MFLVKWYGSRRAIKNATTNGISPKTDYCHSSLILEFSSETPMPCECESMSEGVTADTVVHPALVRLDETFS